MKKRAALVAPPPSRAIARWLGGSFVATLGALLVLSALQVPLGQGYFTYRYSPVRGLRTPRALPAVIAGVGAAGAVMLLARRARQPRTAGGALLTASLAATAVWIWWAPPSPVSQQMFNMTSPSSDGAFALEAGEVPSLPAYLHGFPQRLQLTPEQLGGTRVLSNPPLTTALAYGVRQAFPSRDDGWFERMLITSQGLEPENAPRVADSLRVSVALCVLWFASGLAAYGLGRLFLAPAGAAVFAIVVTFNPCTVHFVPGKDPAQLLTIHLMLWAWFAGWQRRSPALAALGGAILTIGATAGLVHIWVALIALAATLWQDAHDRSIRVTLRNAIAAAVGGSAVCAAAWLALDWNIPATLLAVSRRWGEIQKTFDMSRAIWFLIGLPIFLLFVSPGFWALAGLSLRRRRLMLGTRLALCTLAVMLLIYGVMGVTYELPRLWVAFLPTLALGLATDQPLLRGRGAHPRVARALALIVLVQAIFTTFHWTLLDAREAEYRLTSKRYYH